MFVNRSELYFFGGSLRLAPFGFRWLCNSKATARKNPGYWFRRRDARRKIPFYFNLDVEMPAGRSHSILDAAFCLTQQFNGCFDWLRKHRVKLILMAFLFSTLGFIIVIYGQRVCLLRTISNLVVGPGPQVPDTFSWVGTRCTSYVSVFPLKPKSASIYPYTFRPLWECYI